MGMVDPKSPAKTLALLEGAGADPPIHPGEFDLDAALRRKPQLLALDDLAHPNQGSGTAAGTRMWRNCSRRGLTSTLPPMWVR